MTEEVNVLVRDHVVFDGDAFGNDGPCEQVCGRIWRKAKDLAINRAVSDGRLNVTADDVEAVMVTALSTIAFILRNERGKCASIDERFRMRFGR